jgi:precorrin-2 dehydrogenase/sirohydrochlorin ferrochelatase
VLPVALTCEAIEAVVIGGGNVGTRKARALHDAGARVRVIAPVVKAELANIAAQSDRLTLVHREYRDSNDIGNAEVVIAATDSRETNAAIAKDARALHRLVNVATDPQGGNFVSMAVHRAGQLAIGVTATNVPSAAARIRDAIAARFDSRYANALEKVGDERAKHLGDTRESWTEANAAMVGPDFCDRVESGTFTEATR